MKNRKYGWLVGILCACLAALLLVAAPVRAARAADYVKSMSSGTVYQIYLGQTIELFDGRSSKYGYNSYKNWYLGLNTDQILTFESKSGGTAVVKGTNIGTANVNCCFTDYEPVKVPQYTYNPNTGLYDKLIYNTVYQPRDYDCIVKIQVLSPGPAPEYSLQPESVIAAGGDSVTFSAEASGLTELTYRWYMAAPGTDDYVEAGTGKTLTLTVSEENSGSQVYCEAKDAYGQITNSQVARLTMAAPLTITGQPRNVTVARDQKAVTAVDASGTGLLQYQWYYANEGASKFSKASITGAVYSVTMADARNGRRIYCVVTDAYGQRAVSDTVTLRMADPVVITSQPKSAAAAPGEIARTTVKASGTGTLKYQWYVQVGGKGSFGKSSIATASYGVAMNEKRDGNKVYCVVSDAYGQSARSNTVTLKMKQTLGIVTQPQSVTVRSGAKASVSVVAQGGAAPLKYQWYVQVGGKGSFVKSSITTATYAVTMNEKRNGNRVYCRITDAYGNTVQSSTVTLGMAAPVVITSQPADSRVGEGVRTKVSVSATGTGTLKYQWYYANAGQSAFAKASITTPSYAVSMNEARNGRRLYCVVTDAYGQKATSRTVTISMAAPLQITQQPVSVTVMDGEKAIVPIAVSGEGALKYQWYVQNKDTGKVSKSAVASATYAVTMSEERNGNKVYCVVTDAFGQSVTTNTVSINKVKPLVITSQPQDIHAYNYKTQYFYVSASGSGTLHFNWYYENFGNGVYSQAAAVKDGQNSYSVNPGNSYCTSVYCVVTDDYGQSVTTRIARLYVHF